MLKLIKKFKINKKENIETAGSISPSDKYIKSIEGGILPYWIDAELMSKTGISDLFADNVCVNNALSYEDACDCLERVMKMVDIAEYVSCEFSERSRALNLNSKDNFKNHLDDVKSGKTTDMFKVNHKFYSANTIRDLFIEGQTNAEISPVDRPSDLNVAMARLDIAIGTLRHIKDTTFMAIMISASAAMAEMTGFN